jgi:uncharacterized protein YbjT (DUF2867 family)
LLARGAKVTRANRTPLAPRAGASQVVLDLADNGTYRGALKGQQAIYLILPPGLADALRRIGAFIEQAITAGVERVVFLSSSAIEAGAPGHGEIHQQLIEMAHRIDFAVLRPSWFMQNFIRNHFQARLIADEGRVVSATGDGRVAFIDARDIGEAAATLLVGKAALSGREFVITGPRSLSYGEVAVMFSDWLGREIVHARFDAAGFAAYLRAMGVPAPVAEVLAQLDLDIARGTEDRVTNDIEELTGRAPRSFEDLLRGTATV